MSNTLAIAAVTATLRDLLALAAQPFPGEPSPDPLSDLTVTTRPPDKARTDELANQLNLFLYQTQPNAAFRNHPTPGRYRPGEDAPAPLALTLHDLLTAYGRDNDELLAHRALGRAMSLLHEHPRLLTEDLEAALPGNDLHRQLERVQLTPLVLSGEESSRLWSTLQTPYRLSVAFEASVVLLEGQRPPRTPLPVLRLGGLEEGAWPQPRPQPPFPMLRALAPPHGQPGVRLAGGAGSGDVLTAAGFNLAAGPLTVRVTSPLMPAPVLLTPEPGGSDTDFRVVLPGPDSQWHAGTLTLAAVLEPAGRPRHVTAGLPFLLVPRLLTVHHEPPETPRDTGRIRVTCTPPVWPEQRATLLLGEEELPADPHPALAGTLTFPLPSPRSGTFPVRLRVDGVDSLLVDYTASPPAFDSSQRVTLP